MTAKKTQIAAGFGLAVAMIARDHREDDLAGFLLGDSGIPLADFGFPEYRVEWH